ncbi:CD276 antigen-like [Fundulus heteroclitus]|uniref:CD276 antigen-like n=1 Tax=Fundulus heteroclitus TaxID=8078 RepID=UPI00165A3AFD|nr:CD276 antigen-like [Fundulus heteroclitus]
MAGIKYFKSLLFVTFLLSVSEADTEVSCVFSESCMLPCQYQVDSDPLIHWYHISDGESVVHSYYKDQDQLGFQVENFKNRTSLFQDQISRGNASLLLRGVKVQDEGKYKCYTSTTRGFQQSFVNLKAEAPVSKVIINQEKNRIICTSEGIYPEPELTWSTDPPSNTTALNITSSIQQTEEKLYSISSSLKVSDVDPYLTYSCTVSTQRSRKTVTFSEEADTEVSCVFSESCMLPCQFPFGSEPLIHWMRVSAGDSVVHSYYKDQDQLGYQVENFKNRTSLFQDQISRGNASLLLRGVKVQDEGEYKCYISTMRGFEESFVNVKTEAPVSKVIINQEKNRIICSSEGIYPKPELTWSIDPPSNTTALNITTSVQQTEEKLYSISSSLVVSDDDPHLTYSCTVSTQRSKKTAAIRKPHDLETSHHDEPVAGKVISGVIGAAVTAGIIAVIIYVVKNRLQSALRPSSSSSPPSSASSQLLFPSSVSAYLPVFPHIRQLQSSPHIYSRLCGGALLNTLQVCAPRSPVNWSHLWKKQTRQNRQKLHGSAY